MHTKVPPERHCSPVFHRLHATGRSLCNSARYALFSLLVLLVICFSNTPAATAQPGNVNLDAITDLISAIQVVKDEQMSMLRAAYGLYWFCTTNCSAEQRQNADQRLARLLDARDQFILVTHFSGVRPGPLDSSAAHFVYGSPWGEVPPNCRTRFDRWADCTSRLRGPQCILYHSKYVECRNREVLKNHQPGFRPDSAMGLLSLRANPTLRYDTLGDFETLFLTAMRLDNLIYNLGLGASHAAAVQAMQSAPADVYDFIEAFVKEKKSGFCSRRFSGQRLYERFLQDMYLHEYGTFDLDEAERWFAGVLKAYPPDAVENYLLGRYHRETVGSPRQDILLSLTHRENENKPEIKALRAGLKDDQSIIRNARPGAQPALQCPESRQPGVVTTDPLYQRVIEIWQEADPRFQAEHIMQWIELYNSIFGRDFIYSSLKELVGAYEQSSDRPWDLHSKLFYYKLVPLAESGSSQPDITGTYTATGTDPSGKPFERQVKISPGLNRSGRYQVTWKIPPNIHYSTSALFYKGKLVFFSRSLTPKTLSLRDDGSLVGRHEWTGTGNGDVVQVTLIRDNTALPDVRGYYRVKGTGPNGVGYEGICLVPDPTASYTQPKCRFRHYRGTTSVTGTAQRKESRFHFNWGPNAIQMIGTMNLEIRPDGSLHYRSDDGKQQSTWEPISEAQAVPTSLEELLGRYSLHGWIDGNNYEGKCVLWKDGGTYYFRRYNSRARFVEPLVMDGPAEFRDGSLVVTLTRRDGGTEELVYKVTTIARLIHENGNTARWEACWPKNPWPRAPAPKQQ